MVSVGCAGVSFWDQSFAFESVAKQQNLPGTLSNLQSARMFVSASEMLTLGVDVGVSVRISGSTPRHDVKTCVFRS